MEDWKEETAETVHSHSKEVANVTILLQAPVRQGSRGEHELLLIPLQFAALVFSTVVFSTISINGVSSGDVGLIAILSLSIPI